MTPTDIEPSPNSAVRLAALASHRQVREVLARGLAAVSSARSKPDGADHLLGSATRIAAVVRNQVKLEDERLGPILAQLDAWGPQRRARLSELHEREQVAAGSALAMEADAETLATNLKRAILEILRVLRIEEKELLDADLLDDTTAVVKGQSGG
ncbi:MAG: hypothetical protein U0271_45080 [Polyangiaceae bacterium]